MEVVGLATVFTFAESSSLISSNQSTILSLDRAFGYSIDIYRMEGRLFPTSVDIHGYPFDKNESINFGMVA